MQNQTKIAENIGSFRSRRYRLDKLSLKELWVAYLTHSTVLVYLALGVGAAWFAWRSTAPVLPVLLAAAAVVPIYPMIWYLLHRFVLHGAFLYRSPLTSRVWKRIHFDHHRDPHDLNVLFGALYTTLPTLLIVTLPVGWLIGGAAGAAAAFASGVATTLFYEFNHCIQHLKYAPSWEPIKRIKKLHLQHHFHNEQGNYGITNFYADRWFGTYRPDPRDVSKSPTVFNLGYTGEIVRDYPWVARMTPDIDEQCAIQDGIGRRQLQYQ